MKTLLISVAAAALILPVTACSKNSAETKAADAAVPSALEEGQDGDDAVVAANTTNANLPAVAAAGEDGMARTAYLGATDISAKEMIGEKIYGQDNPSDTTEESVAHVDDLLIGADNKIKSIVYVAGGLGGVGGTKSTIAFNNVGITFESGQAMGENDPLVRVSMTDDQARAAKEFDQNGLNDYRLASEIIGSKVNLASTPDDDDDAVINDLIFSKDGTVKTVIIQHSLVGSIGTGELYAFDFGKLGVEQGDGGLFLNVTEAEMTDANEFEYRPHDAGQEAADDAN